MTNSKMDKSNIIKLSFVDQRRWETFSVFNEDNFPEDLSPIVRACGTRLALFRMEIKEISRAIKRERSWFENELSTHWADISSSTAKRVDPETWVYSDGLTYMLLLYSSFTWLKSLLDVYTRLMCKLIAPKTDMGFNKDKIDGQELSGGRFINWLRNSAPASFANATQLANVLERNSREWISQAVRYRDVISHKQDLDSMHHMCALLKAGQPLDPVRPLSIVKLNIQNPKMPNGLRVEDYFSELDSNLDMFLSETIALLPKINENTKPKSHD